MTDYDLQMLEWISEMLDKAASMARVRTTLHNQPASPTRDEMLRLVAQKHAEVTASVLEALQEYLTTSPRPHR